jgi:hypothetical protein
MRIKEFSLHSTVSKTIQEHIERGIPFTECLFRPGSKAFTEFYSQVRQLYNEGKIELDWQDQELLETDIGQCIVVEGETFSLDVPIEIAEEDEDEDDLLKNRSGKFIRSPQLDAADAKRQHKLFAPTYTPEETKVAGMLKEFLEFFHTYEGVSVAPIIHETARKNHWTFLLANPIPRVNPDHLKKYGALFKTFKQKHGITFDDEGKATRGVLWRMPRFESEVPKDIKTRYTRESVEDEDAVRELVLYADNTGSLYPQKESIMKNLTRKWRKGVYDSELAAKLWLYWATAAAKSYAQEFGYAFSVQDRKAAAKEFEENWRAELEAGNAMESVQEAVEMCSTECCGVPVTECKCGPECKHCDCYEKNKSLSEADYRGKNVELNKPKRGGSKKFYVYVRNPKTGNIKKVSFGAKGMSVKTDDPDRVRNFVARHDCKNRNDKTTASYWSCRLPRYKSLGIKGGQWW